MAALNETARLQEVICSASLNHRVTRAGGHLVPPTAQIWGGWAWSGPQAAELGYLEDGNHPTAFPGTGSSDRQPSWLKTGFVIFLIGT